VERAAISTMRLHLGLIEGQPAGAQPLLGVPFRNTCGMALRLSPL
jgi:hypothetical protein